MTAFLGDWHTQPVTQVLNVACNNTPALLLPSLGCLPHLALCWAYETANQISRQCVNLCSIHRTLSEKPHPGARALLTSTQIHCCHLARKTNGWPCHSWLNLPRFYLILQLGQVDPGSNRTVSSQFDSGLMVRSQTPVLFADLRGWYFMKRSVSSK